MKVAQALAQAASKQAGPPGAAGKRRLPVVQASDAAGLVAMMHEQLDLAIEHRNADAAEAGVVIACGRGCNACCNLPVVVGEPEALAVARWLVQPEHAAIRERFLAAYPAWRAAHGATIEAVVTAGSKDEREQACAEFYRHRAMCPFNLDGDCTIYPVRPALCRTAHAIGSNEKCQDEGAGVDTIEHPETDATYQGQDGMRTVLHHALRPGRELEMLPKAVLRRLTSATAFPNQPCPCGSGLKHKRCCGAG